MTALELPERVRRVLYYLSILVGCVLAVAGKVLADSANGVPWFRGLDGLNGYLLVLIGAVAASHLPGKVLNTETGKEEPIQQAAPSDVPDGRLDELPTVDPQVPSELPMVPDGE